MSRAMTTKQVQDEGLTESQTCSWNCLECKERVWFRGDLGDAPARPACPNCGKPTMNCLGLYAAPAPVPANEGIKRWIQDGNDGFGSQDMDTVADLLSAAGRLLDKAYSQDIVGPILFEGDDDKMYVGNVEFCIEEANPDYVNGILDEIAEEQADDDA